MLHAAVYLARCRYKKGIPNTPAPAIFICPPITFFAVFILSLVIVFAPVELLASAAKKKEKKDKEKKKGEKREKEKGEKKEENTSAIRKNSSAVGIGIQ